MPFGRLKANGFIPFVVSLLNYVPIGLKPDFYGVPSGRHPLVANNYTLLYSGKDFDPFVRHLGLRSVLQAHAPTRGSM